MPRLLIRTDDGPERVVEVSERTVQIGRGPGNDVVLPDPDKGVSRTHAELRFRNGRCVIVDLNSQNGTWLNGQRVEHAEVPPGSEIGVGRYRLRFDRPESGEAAPPFGTEEAPPASTVGFGPRYPTVETSDLPEVPLVRPPDLRGAQRPAAALWTLRSPTLAIAGVALVLVAGGLWTILPVAPQELAMPSAPAVATDAEPNPPPVEPPAPPASIAPEPAPGPAPRTAAETAAPATTMRPVPGAVLPRADPPVIARKPGESSEAWRTRTAAFQTRYAYSRAALDRGDFAAAAGGFEAILREEPGYLDVPQLLVRARAGLRDVARDVFEAGRRLDSAGDWLGALQKFEQARQIHPEVAGLTQAVARVRDKLRAAGEGAFEQGRRFDAMGQWTEALKEYEKAVQWLPPDDPRRGLAQSRIDQLRKPAR
ncbi:MAG: FHA domain-containing protein [Acidobacteriota bacterium]